MVVIIQDGISRNIDREDGWNLQHTILDPLPSIFVIPACSFILAAKEMHGEESAPRSALGTQREIQ
jgi:hypothetical protein